MTIPNNMPNFFIVGAHKAGTTALYEFMRQHPQVYVPEDIKEPCFFRGDPKDHTAGPPVRLDSPEGEAYLALFKEARKEKAIGEASTDYLYYSAKSARNIKQYIPNARIIIVLRNPVERAFSNYVWALKECKETAQSFGEALDLEESRIAERWGHYKAKGFYATQVKDYLDAFGEDQVAVYLYEDLKEDAGKTCREIFAFLGIDDSFEPNTSKKHNISGIPRNLRLQKLLREPNSIMKLGYLLPKGLRSRARSMLLRLNTDIRKSAMPVFDPEVRTYLKNLYRSDIVALQDLIHRDLSSWLT